MKAKNLIMIAIAFLMIGCSRTEDKEEQKVPKETTVVHRSLEGYNIEKWQYEGHDYLIYRHTITHSESCSCKTQGN